MSIASWNLEEARTYLIEAGDIKKDDEDFLNTRAGVASEEYEVQCRGCAPPPCTQELAMAVLIEGFD